MLSTAFSLVSLMRKVISRKVSDKDWMGTTVFGLLRTGFRRVLDDIVQLSATSTQFKVISNKKKNRIFIGVVRSGSLSVRI